MLLNVHIGDIGIVKFQKYPKWIQDNDISIIFHIQVLVLLIDWIIKIHDWYNGRIALYLDYLLIAVRSTWHWGWSTTTKKNLKTLKFAKSLAVIINTHSTRICMIRNHESHDNSLAIVWVQHINHWICKIQRLQLFAPLTLPLSREKNSRWTDFSYTCI